MIISALDCNKFLPVVKSRYQKKLVSDKLIIRVSDKTG